MLLNHRGHGVKLLMTIALYISCLAIIAMAIYVLSVKEKTQLHWAFLVNIACMLLWGLGYALDRIFKEYFGIISPVFLYITGLGASFFPITLWFIGVVFKNTSVQLNRKYLLLIIIPITTNIILWTNQYHQLFYKIPSPVTDPITLGGDYYVYVHIPYFYLFIMLWIFNMTVYAIRNGGILSRQVALAVIGTIPFLLINFLLAVGIVTSVYLNIVGFALMMLFYLFAIVKYDFLNIIPIARDKILDVISDCFVVLDKGFEIRDFNKSFVDTFKDILSIKLKDNFLEILKANKFLGITPEYMKSTMNLILSGEKVLPLEIHVSKDKFDKWFNISVIGINDNKNIGSVITLKNITDAKRNEIISMERVKLLGFAEIAGDLAHDINTPLSTARNAAMRLCKKLNEYQGDINKILENYNWLVTKAESVFNCCDRSLIIANKLRKQVTYIYDEERMDFDLKKLVLKIMRGEGEILTLLAATGCKYTINGESQLSVISYRENLYRVVKNIIKNAIESYIDKETDDKFIEITISNELNDEDARAIIKVKDNGKGIKNSLQNDIFRVPLKTRNLKPDGGGVSLFFAPLIVVGQLEGRIWFESEEDKGTTFYISIPVICREREKKLL